MSKFILMIGLLSGLCIINSALAKNYDYAIRVGAPREYEMVYDVNQNYFYDQNGKPLLYFTAVGGSPSNDWAEGSQATSLSEYLPLPTGIHVRWFSVAENQFWEANYLFNQALLTRLSHYKVNHIIRKSKNVFMKYFDFTVYAVPSGLVTVWISGGGEIYLLGQFQAHKVDEPDWDSFAKSTLQWRELPNRQDFIKERLNDPDSAMSTIKAQLAAGKLPSSAPWKRFMHTYHWSLTVNDEFILKDYWAWYINGEKLYSYDGVKQTAPKAVPYFISFYIASNDSKKQLNRLNIEFDKEEIMAGFEQLTKAGSLTDDITLHLNIDPDFKELHAFLIKGNKSLELNNINPSLEDLYNN